MKNNFIKLIKNNFTSAEERKAINLFMELQRILSYDAWTMFLETYPFINDLTEDPQEMEQISKEYEIELTNNILDCRNYTVRELAELCSFLGCKEGRLGFIVEYVRLCLYYMQVDYRDTMWHAVPEYASDKLSDNFPVPTDAKGAFHKYLIKSMEEYIEWLIDNNEEHSNSYVEEYYEMLMRAVNYGR